MKHLFPPETVASVLKWKQKLRAVKCRILQPRLQLGTHSATFTLSKLVIPPFFLPAIQVLTILKFFKIFFPALAHWKVGKHVHMTSSLSAGPQSSSRTWTQGGSRMLAKSPLLQVTFILPMMPLSTLISPLYYAMSQCFNRHMNLHWPLGKISFQKTKNKLTKKNQSSYHFIVYIFIPT